MVAADAQFVIHGNNISFCISWVTLWSLVYAILIKFVSFIFESLFKANQGIKLAFL